MKIDIEKYEDLQILFVCFSFQNKHIAKFSEIINAAVIPSHCFLGKLKQRTQIHADFQF